MKPFDVLVFEAQQAHFAGWDFSWLEGRYEETPPSWNYRELVAQATHHATAMLDMDTGGGEFLAELPEHPPLTWATENWEPNIPIAEARLNRMGIQVVQRGEDGSLPFDDGTFDLVINRHGSYTPAELFRVLLPGGIFLTQQVGGNNAIGLNEFLSPGILPEYSGEAFSILNMADDLRQAGFRVRQAESVGTPGCFYDIGAVVYYLQVISWQIPGFSVEAYEGPLRALDAHIRRNGRFECISERHLLIAERPFA
ncbi:MAG: class I SAM-dependent methyltransferase [Anaerolineae bacterium]|nr:class I SAM-dependent methyltransferase [Anaerolineae bacterium]